MISINEYTGCVWFIDLRNVDANSLSGQGFQEVVSLLLQ